MANVFNVLEGSCLEVVFEGDQTDAGVRSFIENIDQYIDSHHLRRQTMRYLVDVSNMGKTTVNARMVAAKVLQTRPFLKMAIYAESLYAKHLVEFIIKATGKGRKTRFFSHRPQAEEWICR